MDPLRDNLQAPGQQNAAIPPAAPAVPVSPSPTPENTITPPPMQAEVQQTPQPQVLEIKVPLQNDQPIDLTQEPLPAKIPTAQTKNIRTFQGDVAEAINNKGGSMARIALAESVRKENIERIGTNSNTGKNIGLLILSFVFVAAGVGGLYYAYKKLAPKYLPAIVPPEAEEVVPSIIAADKQVEVNPQEPNIIAKLTTEITNADLAVNQIKNIYFRKLVVSSDKKSSIKVSITASEFLSLINVRPPGTFLRSVQPEFMFGVHGYNKNEPFIILKSDFYENAYAGMLKWEGTMYADFKGLFIKHEIESGVAPETTEDILGEKVIVVDKVIRNKDVRVLKDKNGNILILYSFIDKDTIVITTSEATLNEILTRIENQVIVR